ncbi:MAG: hypothetical protein C4293_07465 [Nitrospiraceae bacterium]
MFIKSAFLLLGLIVTLPSSAPAHASTGDLSTVIERFMEKQFPEAKSHFWVVNGTQWQTDNEVVVDINTVVTNKAGQEPTENRFLLLIVGDKLAAAQNIPLDANTDCQPEEQT